MTLNDLENLDGFSESTQMVSYSRITITNVMKCFLPTEKSHKEKMHVFQLTPSELVQLAPRRDTTERLPFLNYESMSSKQI